MLPKTSAKCLCKKSYDGETKWVHSFIKDDKLIEISVYNGVWNRVSNSIKKNLIANPSSIKKF